MQIGSYDTNSYMTYLYTSYHSWVWVQWVGLLDGSLVH